MDSGVRLRDRWDAASAAGHIKVKYVGQMRGYAEATASIAGRPVVETLIRMPALGKMSRIR